MAEAGRSFGRHNLPMIASVAQLSTALLFKLQCTPEGCHFAVSGGELLGEVVNLVLGGEELIRHERRRFGKVVVGEGSVDHESPHADGPSGYATRKLIERSLA